MPLPMPNSVICSPSHMTKAEPAVKLSTMTMAAQHAVHAPVSRAVGVDEGVVAEALEQGDGHGGVAGDGGQLLPALLAALLLDPLQGRDGHGEQLDDDGAVDIGLHAQGKRPSPWRKRMPLMAPSRPKICRSWIPGGAQQPLLIKGTGTTEPRRKMSSAKMVNRIFLRSSGMLPGVADGLDHLDHLVLSTCRNDLLPWRRRRKRRHGQSASW